MDHATEEHHLKGSAALVTGASTGIGRAIAERLAALGASVAVHGRTVGATRQTVDAINAAGGSAAAVGADLRTLDGCREAVEGCTRTFGGIDILVNNAAVTGPRALTPILELDDERMTEIVSVNLMGVLRCSHFAAVAMRDGGVIINIGSVASYAAQPGCAAYVATKAGLMGLTRALAIDLSGRGIRAVHIAPGDIATSTSDDDYVADRVAQPFARTTPLGRRGRPEEIATIVGFLCTSGASFITGSSILADGGFLAY